MPSVLAALLALALLVLALQDAFEVMQLPRRVHRRRRLVRVHFRVTWAAWSSLARRVAPGPRREHLLSLFGPLSMLLLFALWAAEFPYFARWFEQVGMRPAVQRWLAVRAELQTDPATLSPEEQERRAKLLYHQRARPAPAAN